MSFQTPITIEEALTNIEKRQYLLPAIQREFVWDADQIEILFDSLLRDYPIGSFLFWHVDRENVKDFQFYDFICDYHEFHARHNKKAIVLGGESLTAILDGQQRLTALLIALKGSYSIKIKHKRVGSADAYPKKNLYLNLVSKSDVAGRDWDFRFLTDADASIRNRKNYWFPVGEILSFDGPQGIISYLMDNHIVDDYQGEGRDLANKSLFKLYEVVRAKPVVNYFLERDESLDKVLNIFIRVNSGGTKLSYSDLLLSIATAQWKNLDAREEITTFVDEISSYGPGIRVDKDFVLKTCLVLCDFSGIAFKVDNFTKENMERIESSWAEITDSIRLAVSTVISFGFTDDTLTSKNALIPIAYYMLKIGNPVGYPESVTYREDRENLRMWLLRALLKRTFSGQPDNVLRPTRQVISKCEGGFPLSALIDKFRGTSKPLTFDEDDYEALLNLKYGKAYTFSTLALLYPTLDFRNKFHVDHIFPRSKITAKNMQEEGFTVEDLAEYKELLDQLPNLQLLEGSENISKSDRYPDEWEQQQFPSGEERAAYRRRNYIPDMNLLLEKFPKFMEERKELMRNALKKSIEG